jgi:hypothetical protein
MEHPFYRASLLQIPSLAAHCPALKRRAARRIAWIVDEL